ncbi:hypothetical protein T492DRAFT_866364 [Pavlovales sp. CCMP2436]|nr:hypothetical protein T492DRAFT_866364 [Pavlovales sp. CCMP2436]
MVDTSNRVIGAMLVWHSRYVIEPCTEFPKFVGKCVVPGSSSKMLMNLLRADGTRIVASAPAATTLSVPLGIIAIICIFADTLLILGRSAHRHLMERLKTSLS